MVGNSVPEEGLGDSNALGRATAGLKWDTRGRRRTAVSAPGFDSIRLQIGKHESVTIDDLAQTNGDRRAKHRRVRHERMKLSPLAAGVDAGR
jgi:hypothetical protein